jgi:hypothetical protein
LRDAAAREACARLLTAAAIRTRFARRDAVRARRAAVEERIINARLDNDCGGH